MYPFYTARTNAGMEQLPIRLSFAATHSANITLRAVIHSMSLIFQISTAELLFRFLYHEQYESQSICLLFTNGTLMKCYH